MTLDIVLMVSRRKTVKTLSKRRHFFGRRNVLEVGSTSKFPTTGFTQMHAQEMQHERTTHGFEDCRNEASRRFLTTFW